MRINTNISSLVSYNSLARTTGKLEKSIARLSTGLKVATGADDAAGLAISEKMRAQTKGLDRAYQNAQDGISLLQTAEGAIGDIHDALQRMRELSVHAANGAITDDDRIHIQQQVDQLISHINDIATQTQFNKKKLLDGSAAVLWSTDSLDLGIKVSGTLKYLDKLGAVQSAAGNYKITFSETVTGTENIQKSNILTLKHGTHSTNVAFNVSSDSGLANLQAINMVEGAWRLETREVPFGGVSYYIGDGIEHDPTAVGAAKLDATPSPSIVAPGEYDIRLSNKVPMMAEFDAAYTSGAVDGINVSNLGTSRDFDARFSTTINTTGSGATQDLYDDAVGGAGGKANVGINTDTNANVFTRYDITEVDRRDLSAQGVQIVESYVTGDDARIDMSLTYRSEAGSTAEATYTYKTGAASTVSYESTYVTDNAYTITATLTHKEMQFDAILGHDVEVDVPQNVDITITAGSNIHSIAEQITTALRTTYGITVAHDDLAGDTNFNIQNNSDLLPTQYTVSFAAGGLADSIGLSGRGTIAAGSTNNSFNTGKSYRSAGTINIGANSTIEQVASAVNTAIAGVTATAQTTAGQSHLQLTRGAVDAHGANNITFTGETGTTWAELGNIASVNSAAPVNGTDVRNGFTETVTIGGMNINGIQTALNGLTGVEATLTNAAPNSTTAIRLTTNGIYDVSIAAGAGTALTELGGTKSITRNGATNTATTVNVHNGTTFTTAVIKNGRMNDIQTALNNAMRTALAADGITGNNSAITFGLPAGDQRKIEVDNTALSGYDIVLSNGTSTSQVLDEMWTNVGARSVARGGTSESSAMDWQRGTGTIGNAGMTMQEMMAAINADARHLSAEWVNEAHDATRDGNHWGQLRITNTSADGDGASRRSYTFNGGEQGNQNGLSQSRGLGNRDLSYGKSETTNIWQTSDAFKVGILAQGNYSNGTTIDRNGTVGAANAANYNDRNNNSRDWLWEGGANESDRNAAKLNAQFGNNISANFFTAFQVADGDPKAMNIDKGDTWILFTQAKVADATNLTVKVGDSDTGDQKEVTYSFEKGALVDRDLDLNQMLHRSKTSTQLLQHHIDFGVNADTAAATFSYGERANAGDYRLDEWGNNNTNGTDAWYAHTYYRTDTTYYFSNSSDPAAVLTDITVHKQNDINASILFTAKDGGLEWKMKTITADGAPGAETTGTITAADLTAGPRGSEITINGVRFTNFDINWGLLTGGDKFVVNVAAAAKTETLNLNGAGNFMSYANVSITGDPFQQGNVRTGSSAQYRLKDGKEDGFTTNPMKLLGYFVDPINGANDTRGVGYYDGDLQLTVAAGGFIDGSTVGDTNNAIRQDTTAHRIHAEVNYQGKTQYSAGALVTSGYFQTMEHDSKLVLADYVKGISYSDYEYEIRDGTWKVMNEGGGKEKYNKVNGSLIFDVTNIEGDVLTFRIQGHFIDREGKEYYGEEEEFKLHTGPNTERNTSVVPPENTDDDKVNQPVRLFSDIMFADQEYGGIFLNEMTLGDIDIWSVGDRFTVTLTASGFEDHRSIDEQNLALDSKIDEINIFSDNRGSTMPHSFRFDDGVLDNSTTDLRIYQLSNNFVKTDSDKFYRDQVMDGTLRLSFNEYNPPLDPTAAVDPADPTGGHQRLVHTAATFEVVYGQGDDYGIAHYYSNVEDIAQFWDKNGRYILDGGLETLTIKQGDRETQVNIGQGWEVGELTEALSRAVWNDLLKQHQEGLKGEGELLDMAADKEYMLSKDDMRDIIQFVNTVPGKSDMNSVVGTIVAHSVLSGEGKSLEFYGSVDLQNALGFNTIQQGTDTVFNANVSDAHSGKMVTAHNRVVAGTTSYDLLLGEVGLAVDSDLGITRAVYDEVSGTFKLDVKDQFDQYVHLVDNAMTLQIGANEGEDMFLTLGDMSADTLGVASVNVRSREGAARAITMIDNAISRVSYQRAIVGAQINRLEHTMSNLANTSLNLQESRSRIVDVNLASEMMNRTKLDIVTQAGAAMLVQANQMGSNILTLLR